MVTKESSPVCIRVDDREQRSALFHVLRHEKVDLYVERLSVGDYEIEGQLLVECKTLRDLVASIKEGRLFAQLYRLVQAPLTLRAATGGNYRRPDGL